ncbi:MAG: hypothetical protein K9H49_11595 [Bacteroidales bacterium]|nr:hypothetical protein [Bacteroidales bacterium]
MKKIVSIILFLSFLLTKAYAQEEITTLKELNNNSMYINAGFGLIYATLNVNYELMLKQHMANKNISAFAKVGVGIFEVWGGSGGYTMAQLGLLTGENKHHFELSGGVNLDVPKFGWGDRPWGYPYAANIGWRIQKPNEDFIFRLGIGLPEVIYCGLGFSF